MRTDRGRKTENVEDRRGMGPGGGRGMRLVRQEEEMTKLFLAARGEAEAGSKERAIFLCDGAMPNI